MGGGTQVDTYFDKVIKYIPADIIAAWTAITGLIASAGEQIDKAGLLWIMFAILVVLTPLWVRQQTRQAGLPLARTQIAISTVAFVVWVIALGGPFESLAFYEPLYGSLLLIVYTLVAGLVTPPEDNPRKS
ncbi:MAG: hypothetical protein AAFR99_18730 [Cyanobacteria bacterium J06629_9]